MNVKLIGAAGNRSATGAKIRILEPGTGKLLWYEQVGLWGRQSFHNYYAVWPTERHFGLGEQEVVDVLVEFGSGKRVEKKGVKADGVVEVKE